MRILLILARDRLYRHEGPFRRILIYAPLMLTTLAALVPEELDAHIDLVDEGTQKPDYEGKLYDVVGISCVSSSSTRAYSLAEYWRAKGAFVVLGGVHPTLLPEEAGQHADAIVVGLAEEPWPQLLRDWQAGTVRKTYHADHSRELSCPAPRRDLQGNRGYLPLAAIVANRSCKNNCEFCSVHRFLGRKGVTRPISEVVDEIRRLKPRGVMFYDPNLAADREYTSGLLEALIPLRLRWGGSATVDIIDDKELLDLAVRSGCEMLLFGLESFSQPSLNRSGKSFNQVSRYKEAVRITHEHGIGVLGCFVLGFDDDTKDGLKRTVEAVDDLGIDLPRYTVLTPFPGTRLFSRLEEEGRILTRDWSLYDTQHVVYQPKHLAAWELQQILHEAWKRSFVIPRVARRVARSRRLKLLSLVGNLGGRFYARGVVDEGAEHLDWLANQRSCVGPHLPSSPLQGRVPVNPAWQSTRGTGA